MGEILHSECPTAKLIIVYRDPVARAISHYFHDRRYGTISRRLSVSYVLFPDFLCNRYINESLYGKHLTSLLKHFRPEQIYVFASPQDSEDPVEQFTDLQRYLGAKHADLPLEGFNEKINHRKIPFIPSLHWQAAFGKAGIVKLISRLIDPVNCALGSMLGYSEISRGDRELFANLIKESEQGDFFTLCEKNDIAGWKFIKKPST